ncbi:hypothetical protein NC652_024279 [Populus alba x Populus x berolinensis]|nr:hypothetical protein NC652_024279 [Populus alba x Populus x berolinensis]
MKKKKQLKLMLLWVTAQQWRWKIFEQCQRYWILATAFTEESCLLRARQPSSMLDLAKGNEDWECILRTDRVYIFCQRSLFGGKRLSLELKGSSRFS